MIEQLKNTFGEQRTIDCLSTDNRIEFYIAENDATSRSYIVPISNTIIDIDKCFIIKNLDNKTISHLSIDGCFLTEEHGYTAEKCDFITFSDDKFCFVELKSNAERRRQTSQNLRKARKQLGATINHFDDNGIDFSEYDIEAYIVLKNRLYPSNSASVQQRRVQFYDDYEVDLIEGSEVTF